MCDGCNLAVEMMNEFDINTKDEHVKFQCNECAIKKDSKNELDSHEKETEIKRKEEKVNIIKDLLLGAMIMEKY